MQDEVHRYAISFHRQVRSKSLFSSILDEVEGIGEARKKKLLNHFKSVKKMKEASLEELEAVIPKNTGKESSMKYYIKNNLYTFCDILYN